MNPHTLRSELTTALKSAEPRSKRATELAYQLRKTTNECLEEEVMNVILAMPEEHDTLEGLIDRQAHDVQVTADSLIEAAKRERSRRYVAANIERLEEAAAALGDLLKILRREQPKPVSDLTLAMRSLARAALDERAVELATLDNQAALNSSLTRLTLICSVLKERVPFRAMQAAE